VQVLIDIKKSKNKVTKDLMSKGARAWRWLLAYIPCYEGRSEINASYLFPWKLH